MQLPQKRPKGAISSQLALPFLNSILSLHSANLLKIVFELNFILLRAALLLDSQSPRVRWVGGKSWLHFIYWRQRIAMGGGISAGSTRISDLGISTLALMRIRSGAAATGKQGLQTGQQNWELVLKHTHIVLLPFSMIFNRLSPCPCPSCWTCRHRTKPHCPPVVWLVARLVWLLNPPKTPPDGRDGHDGHDDGPAARESPDIVLLLLLLLVCPYCPFVSDRQTTLVRLRFWVEVRPLSARWSGQNEEQEQHEDEVGDVLGQHAVAMPVMGLVWRHLPLLLTCANMVRFFGHLSFYCGRNGR